MTTQNVRAHVFVHGTVQGVFFRAFARDKALEFGVTGWVRNLPDGRVEAVMEGDESAVKELIRSCKIGPPGAAVTRVDANFERYKGEFSGFRISYFVKP